MSGHTVEFSIKSVRALEKAIPAVLEAIGPRRKIALYGDMGAGKTTFVKALCRQLGVQDATASPTFSLVNEYRYTKTDGSPGLLRHLDLYRLRTIHEALDIGIEAMLYEEAEAWCLIEWPQLVEPILPENTARIELVLISERTRQLRVSC